MRIAEIKPIDILNGEGLRVSVFVSGCTHYCQGCFNKRLWNFDIGEEFSEQHKNKIINTIGNEEIHYFGLSLLGGEPFALENVDGLLNLCQTFKTKFPDKDIWAWSGYTYEYILSDSKRHELLKQIDILIDGKFLVEEKDLNLKYRGSRNQRVINVKESLQQNCITHYGVT